MKNIIELDSKIRTEDLEFINKPIVIELRDFDENGTAEFSKQMSKAHETGQPIIPIVVDSYGGEVYSLFSMISSNGIASIAPSDITT